MRPSVLLPSHDQTTFQCWPAATTPGIAGDAGRGAHSGGAAAFAGSLFAAATCLSRSELSVGVFLHLARTAGCPGFFHACRLLPRGWLEDGLCAAAAAAPQARSTARATRVFMSSVHVASRGCSFGGELTRLRYPAATAASASEEMTMEKGWWGDAVYEIYPRSWRDSDGDGVGDIAGMLEKLDYLEWLGITTGDSPSLPVGDATVENVASQGDGGSTAPTEPRPRPLPGDCPISCPDRRPARGRPAASRRPLRLARAHREGAHRSA